jgi:hypothetical protein
VANHYCAGTTCTPKKALGEMCTAGPQCTSGNCVDGVCCMDSGCPTCQACNINGGGTCADVPNGMADPPNCAANGECGNTGTCNGSGACTQQPASTSCGLPESCTNATHQPPSQCSGSGTCNQTSPQTCGGFLACDTNNMCRPSCSSDSHCIGGYYCSDGGCVPNKGLGEMCGRDGECNSTYCTEGFCCQADVCPMCHSCAIAATRGICTQVAAGQPDPSLTCVDQTPASCGTNGLCNAGGTCDRYDISTECATSCDGTNVTHTYCDVTGSCSGLSLDELCLSQMCSTSTNMCLPPPPI